MNPNKVDRTNTSGLTDLPNVGPAIARLLVSIGIGTPGGLVGQDPMELYVTLCAKRGRQDPCVLDTLMSITDFMNGNEPRPWWTYTAERKQRYGRLPEAGKGN